MTPAVEAARLRKRYGSVVAVEDLSFAAEAGEILPGRQPCYRS